MFILSSLLFFTLASSFPILFQTEAALSHSGRDRALSSEWRCWSAGDRHFHCNQKATTILTLNVIIQTYGFQIEMWREDEGGKKRDSRHGKDRGGVNNNRFVFAHLPVNYFSVFIAFTKRSDSCFWVTRCSLVYKLMVPNDSSQCTVIKSSILQGNLSSLKI